MSNEEYELVPEVITELSKKTVEESKKLGVRIARILIHVDKLRRIILDGEIPNTRIVKIPYKALERDYATYAVDSSYRSPLPLVFGDLFVVIGGYIRYPRAKTNNTKINRGLRVLIRCREELLGRVQSAIAKIVERNICLDILKRQEFEEFPWDFLMIDGPIVPLWPIILFTKNLYVPEKRFVELTKEIVNVAWRKKKSILGIIKRVRTHFVGRGILSYALEKRILSIPREIVDIIRMANDKTLVTLILNPGEALIMGSYNDEEDIDENMPLRALRVMGKLGNFQDFISDNNDWIRNVDLLFIKPARSKHIVRVEILDYGNKKVDNILRWLNMNSSHTACPYVLDMVDRYTSMTNTIYELVRKLMIRSTSESISEELKKSHTEDINILLDLADLQKKYVPNMG